MSLAAEPGAESWVVRGQETYEGLVKGSLSLGFESTAASRASSTSWANVKAEAMEFSAFRTASRA
jgi:hypothetical protein